MHYLIRDIFAETYFKDSYVYLDFKTENEVRAFCSETANPEKIIEYRSSTVFKSKEDIMSVNGIGSKIYEKIKDRITV